MNTESHSRFLWRFVCLRFYFCAITNCQIAGLIKIDVVLALLNDIVISYHESAIRDGSVDDHSLIRLHPSQQPSGESAARTGIRQRRSVGGVQPRASKARRS